MFTRGRPCLKRCGLSTIAPDRAAGRGPHPDEPLLFLYPRWFASAVRQQRRSIHSIVSRKDTSKCSSRRLLPSSTLNRPRPRKQSFGASTRKRWLSTRSTPLLPKSGSDEPAELAPTGPVSEAESPPTGTRNDAVDGEVAPRVKGTGLFDAFEHLGDVDEGIDTSKVEREYHKYKTRQEWRGVPLRRPPREEVQKHKEFLQQIPPRQARRLLRRQFYFTNVPPQQRATMYYAIGRFLGRMEIHGRKMGFLEPDFFSKRQASEEREILVPDETIAAFAGVSEKFSQSENVWYERLLSGCRVHVLPVSESEGQNRKVVLQGSPRATEVIANRILRLQQLQARGDPLVEITKPHVPVFPSRLALERSGITAPVIRGVWAARSHKRAPVPFSIIRSQWGSLDTVKGFVEHVEALTTSLPSPTNPMYHPARVAAALFRLFDDELQRHLISTTALNIALSYFIKHGFLSFCIEFLHQAGFVATTETANILLKEVAKKQNLQEMKRILRLMNRFRILPNVDTWLAFVDCLISPKAKIEAVKEMEKKGYLQDQHAMRRVLHVTVQDLFTNHLQSGRSVDEFFDKVVMAIGPSISRSLTLQMFNVTVQLKDQVAMKRLLEIYKERKLPLDSQVAGEVVKFFPRDAISAIYYTLQCLKSPDADFDTETYERLFLSAFNSKFYNTSRVLWRYACMNQKTTRPMRHTMYFLLMTNVAWEQFSERERLWWTCAGKVIAGVSLHLPDYPLKDKLLQAFPPEFHNDPIASVVSTRRLEGKERQQQRIRAKAIVKHDIQIGPWYRPVLPLGHMLDAALLQDTEWGSIPRPARWYMQHAVQVPVELVGHNVEDVPPVEQPSSRFLTLRPLSVRRRRFNP
ncbi:uncharacterized protein BDV17DRAFT_264297 [Aspergillus undulatus]|uniref:uncharacterized protein n=1 Tax=Aspergillus undulatus TaxID=1810928 RepID=UPI003CCE0D63